MNLPTEVRYRPYADWTDEEKQRFQRKWSANHLGVGSSPYRTRKQGLLNDANGFLTLVVSSNFLPKLAI